MKINWFTLIAQIINFLILVWLLKRYLYKPILDAIDAREKRIASRLSEAESIKEEAMRENDKFRLKNERFDEQKKEILGKVVSESEDERQRLLEQARNEANSLNLKLDKELKEKQRELNREIAENIRKEVLEISRKTLADLASTSLEEQAAETFVRRLNELDDEQKERFLSAFTLGSDPILVRSAFGLPKNIQSEIQDTAAGLLGTEPEIDFTIMPDLLCGIDLTINGYKLEWSVSEYLNSLENGASGETQDQPGVRGK